MVIQRSNEVVDVYASMTLLIHESIWHMNETQTPVGPEITVKIVVQGYVSTSKI